MGILPDWMIERDVKITPAEKYDKEKQAGKVSFGYTSYGYDARIGYKFQIFSNVWCGVVDPKKWDPKAFIEVDRSPKPHDFYSDGFCRYCSGTEFNGPDQVLDKNICPRTKLEPDHIMIPPNSFALGETIEHFDIPRDVLCLVVGKSTYARCGIIVNVTPGEPEWKGKWTVEISNTTPLPAKIYAGEGIMQCVFIRTDGHEEALYTSLNYFFQQNSLTDKEFDPPAANAQKALQMLRVARKSGTCLVSYADKKGKYQNQTGLTAPTMTKKDGE